MASGTLYYVSQIDEHLKKFTDSDSDSLKLLDGLKKAFRELFINDFACGHGAEIWVFENCIAVFHYVFNNGDWRDKTAIFSRR